MHCVRISYRLWHVQLQIMTSFPNCGRGRWKSLKAALLDRSCIIQYRAPVSYWPSIVTMAVSLTVYEIFIINASACSNTIPLLTATRLQIADLVSPLEHFEEATNSLQADNVTASLVIPANPNISSSAPMSLWQASANSAMTPVMVDGTTIRSFIDMNWMSPHLANSQIIIALVGRVPCVDHYGA